MNIPKQLFIPKIKNVLYTSLLLTLFNQQLVAQNNLQKAQDTIFQKLEFSEPHTDRDIELTQKISNTHSYKELLELINTDQKIWNMLNNYLHTINKTNNEPIWNATMGWFLLSLWIAVDTEYNQDLTITWMSTINYNNIITYFPWLSTLKITNQEPINVFLVSWETESRGLSSMNGNIIIMDNHKEKDATLLNEISWELFSRYIKDVKTIHPELIYKNNIYLPNNIWDSIIDKLLWSHIIDTQRNEYRWDLSNLSFDVWSHIEHMLLYAVIEDWYTYSFSQRESIQDPTLAAASFIKKDYPNYLLSKHFVKKFLLSKDFLSSIKYKYSNLWIYYQDLIQKEAKDQFNKQVSKIQPYWEIAKSLSEIIKNDHQALLKIQHRASKEKEKLDNYLNLFIYKK